MTTLPFLQAADLVKSRLDIVDVVSRVVVLKKTGRNYSGLCPFHSEKSPSFTVSREKNLFKCFGCGEAGDALAFLMKRDRKTYGEVIHELAEAEGIQILREGRSAEQAEQQRGQQQKIYELNQAALDWFSEQIQSQTHVQAYLQNREITPDLMEQFGLGYAPAGWENLTQYLFKQMEFLPSEPSLLVTAGLASVRQEGQGQYDRFRNRLIIPIFDEQGKVAGFGGRALSDEDKPKYLNSPETPIYQKSRILYGLFQAKQAIRETASAVVMEGYFDVITAHRAGVTQAVGSCGTALTEGHLKLLTRFGAETIYLAFDSDPAGLKASLSAIALIEPYLAHANLTLKVVVVPQGKDPDDFIQTHGGDAFKALMAEAKPFLDFKFEMALQGIDLTGMEGRISAANQITPLLSAIQQPILRSETLKRYAEQIGVAEDALRLEVDRFERGNSPFPVIDIKNSKKSFSKEAIFKRPSTSLKRAGFLASENVNELRQRMIPRELKAEKDLLRLLFFNEESYSLMVPLLDQFKFAEPIHQQILHGVFQWVASITSLEAMLNQLSQTFCEQEEVRRVYADLALTAEQLGETLKLNNLSSSQFEDKICQEANQLKKVIEHHRRNQNLRQLAQQLKDIEQSSVEGEGTSVLELHQRLRESLTTTPTPQQY